MKLVMGEIAELGTLKNEKHGLVRCQYLVELEKMQFLEGLRLDNKLKKAYINWKPQRTKIYLAVQPLCSSLADALQYCESKLELQQFKGCEETIKFFREFDHLFDILNYRNPIVENAKHQ